jgi:hypothetical protein
MKFSDRTFFWLDRNYLPVSVALWLAVLALLSLLGAVINTAHAADATVSWTHPTQYTDGTALPIDKIRETAVQFGTCTTATPPGFGTLTRETIVPAPAATVKLTAVAAGTYCFRAKTVDVNTQAGAWSAVVQKAVVDVKPRPPTALGVTSP